MSVRRALKSPCLKASMGVVWPKPGKVLERRFIMETVWQGAGGDIRPGTVDKHIESLRRKLGRYGEMVCTVYGVGYAFRET